MAVASRFAKALVDIVTAPGSSLSPDAALAQLRTFESMWRESSELRTILVSPAVGAAKKRAAAGRMADMQGFDRTVRNFLFVLIDHRRTGLLGAIIQSMEALLDDKLGIVRTAITSARTLDESQQGDVEGGLARLTGKRVVGQYAVDESLIGGVVARVGSKIYDGSVRGQLDALRGRLMRA